MSEPTREQQEYLDHLASTFGAAHVVQLSGERTLFVCGWESTGGAGEGSTGRRAPNSRWEWLRPDGEHGLVDGTEYE